MFAILCIDSESTVAVVPTSGVYPRWRKSSWRRRWQTCKGYRGYSTCCRPCIGIRHYITAPSETVNTQTGKARIILKNEQQQVQRYISTKSCTKATQTNVQLINSPCCFRHSQLERHTCGRTGINQLPYMYAHIRSWTQEWSQDIPIKLSTIIHFSDSTHFIEKLLQSTRTKIRPYPVTVGHS